jgi:hypothetical protein
VLGHLLVRWVERKSVFRLRTDALGLEKCDGPHRTSVLEPRIALRGLGSVRFAPHDVVLGLKSVESVHPIVVPELKSARSLPSIVLARSKGALSEGSHVLPGPSHALSGHSHVRSGPCPVVLVLKGDRFVRRVSEAWRGKARPARAAAETPSLEVLSGLPLTLLPLGASVSAVPRDAQDARRSRGRSAVPRPPGVRRGRGALRGRLR